MHGKVSACIVGDIDGIATEAAKLNIRRTTAVAFLVALIIGCGVSMIGELASTNDYIQRSIYHNVGAEISVGMFSKENATSKKSN